MARDNHLPFSDALAWVSGASRTPVLPAILLGLFAAGILVVNVNFPQVIEVLVSVSIVWANLAYLLVTIPMLCAGSPAGRRAGGPRAWNLRSGPLGTRREPGGRGLGAAGRNKHWVAALGDLWDDLVSSL